MTKRYWANAFWDITQADEQAEAMKRLAVSCGKLGLRHVAVFSADGADTLVAVACSRAFDSQQAQAYLKEECDIDLPQPLEKV